MPRNIRSDCSMTEIECPKCKHTWEDDELINVDEIHSIAGEIIERRNDND